MPAGFPLLLWLLTSGKMLFTSVLAKDKLPVKYSWSTVEFQYDNERQRSEDLRSGAFNPFNIIILDSDFYKGKYYVTTPACLPGSPATLSTVTDDLDSNGNKLLKPFPDWSWQNKSSCDSIISVFRIKIDQLGRMWVIDCGVVDAFTDSNHALCPPKLLAFDLNNNNTLITKYVFSENQISSESLPLHVEVQILNDEPDDTVVYISDPTAERLLIYHLASNESYMIEHPYFTSDPVYINYTINGVSFTLEDGIFTTAIDSTKDILYFHGLSSGYECFARGEILRKTTPLTQEEKLKYFKRFSYRRKMHSSSEVLAKFNKTSYLIFATLEDNALKAWNTQKPYNRPYFKVIAKNYTLDFVSGMKYLKGGKRSGEILVTSSRLQNVIAFSKNDIGRDNFRILRGRLADLLIG